VRRLAPMLLCLVLCACASGPVDADVVSSVTDQAITPAFDTAAVDASALLASIETFCGRPDDGTLEDARNAWRAAKSSWEVAEVATMYGPGQMLRVVAKVDYEPVDTEGIEELLVSDTVIDVDYVDNRSAATRRGLGTVEYLLFEVLEEAPSERRACALATAVTSVIVTETANLLTAWTDSYEGAEPFGVTFTEATSSDSAMGDIILSMVDTLKRQARFELGRALAINAREPQLDAIPEGPAGAGAERYQAQLRGIRSQLTAGGESSLTSLLTERSEEVANRVDALLDDSLTELSTIDEPLARLVREDPDRLTAAQALLAELVTVFEADVVSTLDITLGFSDTDGDSG
jgi:predicted lipoprotein